MVLPYMVLQMCYGLFVLAGRFSLKVFFLWFAEYWK